MRILILSHAFEPNYTACAVRWGAIARELSARGAEVLVISAWTPGTAREEVLDGVRVRRVGGELSAGLRARLRRSYSVGSGVQGGRASGGGIVRRALVWGNYSMWTRVYWPDHACMWYFAARSALEDALCTKWDAVVSVAFPFTDHLVALRADVQQKGAVWIAESGDPFSFLEDTPPNNLGLYRRLNRRIDVRVTQRASAFVVPNDELRQLYVSSRGVRAGSVRVIPHVVSIRERSGHDTTRRTGGGDLSLCYAGAFASGVRRPDSMLETVREMIRLSAQAGRRVKLDLYGSLNDCQGALGIVGAEIASGAIRVHGEVPPAAARVALEQCDVLVNVGNLTWFRQPSKVAEYMALGKPILNFAPTSRDSSESMLAGYPASLTLTDGAGSAAMAATQALQFVKSAPPVSVEVRDAVARKYSRAAVAEAFLSLIAELRSAVVR